MANQKIKQQLGCFVIHKNLNEDKSLEEETLKYKNYLLLYCIISFPKAKVDD